MSNIRVRFVSNQGAEDIFKSPDTHRLFIRMPSTMKDGVVWCTGTKWTGGVEAACPLTPETIVSVLDGEGNTLFTEQATDDWTYFDSTPIWHKRGCFSYEATKQLAATWRDKLNLKSYEAWKEWLCSYKDISDDPDNWCFFETETLDRTILESVEYLGIKCYVVSYLMRHKIAGLVEWTGVCLEDRNHSCLDICGYSFEEASLDHYNAKLKEAYGETIAVKIEERTEDDNSTRYCYTSAKHGESDDWWATVEEAYREASAYLQRTGELS